MILSWIIQQFIHLLCWIMLENYQMTFQVWFCVLNFISILSNFLSQRNWHKIKLRNFEKLQFLNDKKLQLHKQTKPFGKPVRGMFSRKKINESSSFSDEKFLFTFLEVKFSIPTKIYKKFRYNNTLFLLKKDALQCFKFVGAEFVDLWLRF